MSTTSISVGEVTFMKPGKKGIIDTRMIGEISVGDRAITLSCNTHPAGAQFIIIDKNRWEEVKSEIETALCKWHQINP